MTNSLGSSPLPTHEPPPPAAWYPDPESAQQLRWWDGVRWTEHVNVPPPVVHDPLRQPRWWSWPVVVCTIPVLALVVYMAIQNPLNVPAGLVPILIVGPVLLWLDRIEPEPWQSRMHAYLWGATVAVVVSLVCNTAVSAIAGERVGAVISAPLVEEAMKGLGLVWAARRKEIDGTTDGIVFAGWVALGFLTLEDIFYLAQAPDAGTWTGTFIARVFVTPFAHPLMTMWIGYAIGRAIERRKPLASAWWGYPLAILVHMGWNGTLTAADSLGESGVVLVLCVGLLYVGLFVGVVVWLKRRRTRNRNRFVAFLPFLAAHYGLAGHEMHAFSSWQSIKSSRKQLRGRARRRFDTAQASLAKLWLMHARVEPLDPQLERRQYDRMRAALDEVNSIVGVSTPQR